MNPTAPTPTSTPRERLQSFAARAVSRLNPAAIRDRQFPTKRRGLHPEEVSAFLTEVAGEIAALHRELIIVHQENDRLKRALRDWQTRQATKANLANLRVGPTWPINQVKAEHAAG